MNETMSPRVGLIDLDVDGWPVLPQNAQVTLPDLSTPTVPVWDGTPGPSNVGAHPSREYRHSMAGHLVTVVLLATGTLAGVPVGLAIAWVPAAGRLADNPTFDMLISGPTIAPHVRGLWPVVADANGNLTVPSLDVDASAAGLLAQSLWPVGWRVRLPTDSAGDPMHGVPAAPPTGPRCIMEGVA